MKGDELQGHLKASFEHVDKPIYKELERTPENFKEAGDIENWAKKAEGCIRNDVQQNFQLYVADELARLRLSNDTSRLELTPPGTVKDLERQARENVRAAIMHRYDRIEARKVELMEDLKGHEQKPVTPVFNAPNFNLTANKKGPSMG